MRIRIDTERLRNERDRRAWSQAHLAKVTGLGLRTVQRIEKTGFASADSLKALASVFSLAISDLRVNESSAKADSPQRVEAKNSTEGLIWVVLFLSSGVFAGTVLHGYFAHGIGLERFEVGRAIFAGLFAFLCGAVLLALAQLMQRLNERSSSSS